MLVHWHALLVGGVYGDSRPAKVSLQETSHMEVDLHDKFVVARRVHAQSWDAVRGCKPKVSDGSVPAVSHNCFEDAERSLSIHLKQAVALLEWYWRCCSERGALVIQLSRLMQRKIVECCSIVVKNVVVSSLRACETGGVFEASPTLDGGGSCVVHVV